MNGRVAQVCIKPTYASRKRACTDTNGGDDHISNLPDDIIGVILSLLPMKEAVQTCVLSKQWELKWTLICNVNIDAKKIFPESWSHKGVFNEFVEKVLINLHHIKRLHLRRPPNERYGISLTTWISALLRRKIESIELRYVCHTNWMSSDREVPTVLPRSLLNCASLKNLVVDIPYILKVALCNSFVNLTRLQFHYVEIVNNDSSSDTVLFNFPVLKKVDLHHCKWLKMKFVEINAPSLKKFRSRTYNSGSDKVDIKIIGDTLEKLNITCGGQENFILNSSTVAFANLEFDNGTVDDYLSQRQYLLGKLSHVNSMQMTGFLEETAHTKLGSFPLPNFLKLEKLEVSLGITVEVVLQLLHVAPILKSLHIFTVDSDDDYYDFDAVKSVPACLATHFENFELEYDLFFCEEPCKEPRFLSLVAFFLKNGVKLKNVSIGSCSCFSEDDIVKQLLTYPKASDCIIIALK